MKGKWRIVRMPDDEARLPRHDRAHLYSLRRQGPRGTKQTSPRARGRLLQQPARPKLTDAFIAKIRAPGIHRDGPGGIPGLLIRAGKTARTWELRSERPPKFTKTL